MASSQKNSVPNAGDSNTQNLQADNFPLTKSKSHESQLAIRVDSTSDNNLVR